MNRTNLNRFLLISMLALCVTSCTKYTEDEGHSPIEGSWQLVAYEVVAIPSSLQDEVVAILYPEGFPPFDEPTGYVFSGKYYCQFDPYGETAKAPYEIEGETLTLISPQPNGVAVRRELRCLKDGNTLRIGNSIFEEETCELYRDFRSELNRILNTPVLERTEEDNQKLANLLRLQDENSALIDLFERGLEQVYFYAVYNKVN